VRRLAVVGSVFDVALRLAMLVRAAAGDGPFPPAGRLRRALRHVVPASRPQRAATDRGIDGVADAAHVAAVAARARAVALGGGGRANRCELIGVIRIAATTTATTAALVVALVVALVITVVAVTVVAPPLHVAVAAVASRARVSNARTSESAERGHRHQPEEKSQREKCAGCHSHCSLRSARGDARLEKPRGDCPPVRQVAIPKVKRETSASQ